jgi:hypothetical protein
VLFKPFVSIPATILCRNGFGLVINLVAGWALGASAIADNRIFNGTSQDYCQRLIGWFNHSRGYVSRQNNRNGNLEDKKKG